MGRWPIRSKLLLVPVVAIAIPVVASWLLQRYPADGTAITVAATAIGFAVLGFALYLAHDLKTRLGSLERILLHAAVSTGTSPAAKAPGDELAWVEQCLQHSLQRMRERDTQRRRSAELLEFAQVAGGFGVFDLNLVTTQVIGTPLLFARAGVAHPPLLRGRHQCLATVHPED